MQLMAPKEAWADLWFKDVLMLLSASSKRLWNAPKIVLQTPFAEKMRNMGR